MLLQQLMVHGSRSMVALLRLPFRCCAACNVHAAFPSALLLLLVRSVSSVDPVCPVVVISTTGVSATATSEWL